MTTTSHKNKKIKLNNNSNDYLFLKIWRNIVIKVNILSFLSTNEENTFKYEEIKSVNWMISNGHIGLLKDKVETNEHLDCVSQEEIFKSVQSEDNHKFYQNLFRNYNVIDESTCQLLVECNCLIGYKVLQLYQQEGKYTNIDSKPNSKLFICSISNGSFAISDYFYKNFKSQLKYSEKELWNTVIKDNEMTLVPKITYIIKTLPINSNFQIPFIKFNFSFYKSKFQLLLDCCFIISSLKVNLKNYITNQLNNQVNLEYPIFKSIIGNNINECILTTNQLKPIQQSVSELEKDTIVYKLIESNSNIENLLKMILPFIKRKDKDHEKSNSRGHGCFENSLNFQVFKFSTNKGIVKKLLNERKELQLKYGVLYSIVNNIICIPNFKSMLKFETNNEKRTNFLIQLFENHSSIIEPAISYFCKDNGDLQSIKLAYRYIKNQNYLPQNLEYWKSIEIFDHFKKHVKFTSILKLYYLLMNNVQEIILNHFYENYNDEYNQGLIELSNESFIFSYLNIKNSIHFFFNHHQDFIFLFNDQVFFNTWVNYGSNKISLDLFKQLISNTNQKIRYSVGSIFKRNRKEYNDAKKWVTRSKPTDLINGNRCIDV